MRFLLFRIIYIVVASTAVAAIPTYAMFTVLTANAATTVGLPLDDDPIRNGFRVTSAREPAALAQSLGSRGDTSEEIVPTVWTFTSKANPSPWQGGGSATTTMLTGTTSAGSIPSIFPPKFTATVTGTNKNSPPALTVTFYDGGTILGIVNLTVPASGQTSTATFSKNFSPGKHIITAKYNGDFNDQPSTSNAITLTISAP